MSVTIDDQPMQPEKLGFTTLGEVLSHLQKQNRLVVHVLIDGNEPDLDRMGQVKRSPLQGHTVYIETAEPRQMALDVLDQVERHLEEADKLREGAVLQLQTGQSVKAMEKLSGCFSIWQHAQESILKTAQLLRIDLSKIVVDERPFTGVIEEFAGQLKRIRQALEDRDFVTLTDTLAYESTHTGRQWREAIDAIRATIE